MKKYILIVVFLISSITNAQSLEKTIKNKIKDLKSLVKKAERTDIDVLKEKTTIRTAQIFLKYANWDEKNIEINESLYKLVPSFKKKATKMAQNLPNFERNEVNLMLDKALGDIKSLLTKKSFRKPSVQVDWSKVSLNKDQLTFNNRPVFLADYTWKPKTKQLTEFHGDQDGFFLTPSFVTEKGSIKSRKLEELNAQPTNGSLGFIFMNHKGVPKWAKEKFGPNFSMREDTYTTELYKIRCEIRQNFHRIKKNRTLIY